MKKAVIYARFSSHSQTEQSIEGQLRVCNEYAKANDIVIVDTYIDSTTGEVLKSFYLIIRPYGNYSENSDYCIMMLVGAKGAFSLVGGNSNPFWGRSFNGLIVSSLIKGTSQPYGDKYTLQTSHTLKLSITANTKIYRRKKLTPNIVLEEPTP